VGWTGLGQWAFVLAAFGGVVLGVWQIDRQRRGKPVSRAAILAILVSAVWGCSRQRSARRIRQR
jgi:drug/metabolite transporter (DMT)-like permease